MNPKPFQESCGKVRTVSTRGNIPKQTGDRRMEMSDETVEEVLQDGSAVGFRV